MAVLKSSRPREHKSEQTVYDALSGLPDIWTVFHSVSWLGPRGGRVMEGEADFVVLHPDFGLITLEVKGGGIDIRKGRWISRDRYGEIHRVKDPYRQAAESARNLGVWLKDVLPFGVRAGHAVVFSDLHDLSGFSFPPNAPSEITVTAADFPRMEEKLHEIFGKHGISPGLSLSAKETKKVVNALAPTTRVRRALSDEASEAESRMIELTENQKQVFEATRRNPKVIVYGSAGTGKTVLAAEKARQLSEGGGRTLLVCYNRLLSERLAASGSLEGVAVRTFHGLCLEQMDEAGIGRPEHPYPDEWYSEKAPYDLMEAAEKTGNRFDAVVVDEGQDFRKSWLEALECICGHGGKTPFYVFADGNQDLFGARDWQDLEESGGWFRFDLRFNCRNTREISSRVESVGGGEVWKRAASGPEPRWTESAKGEAAREKAVSGIVKKLLDERFPPEEIVVLCEHRSLADRLNGKTVAEAELRAAGGDGAVRVETIKRFKGLESRAAVVVLGDEEQEPDVTAYVGFSRARTCLHVIGPRSRKKSARWQ